MRAETNVIGLVEECIKRVQEVKEIWTIEYRESVFVINRYNKELVGFEIGIELLEREVNDKKILEKIEMVLKLFEEYDLV